MPLRGIRRMVELCSLPKPDCGSCGSASLFLPVVFMQEPQLLQAGFLADLVASRQLFAFHLPDMCEEGSASAALFDAMSAGARAQGKLLSVMGYFPQQEVSSVWRSTFARG